jgi:hypothetical protein
MRISPEWAVDIQEELDVDLVRGGSKVILCRYTDTQVNKHAIESLPSLLQERRTRAHPRVREAEEAP